ncbi:DUF1302 domain-containing protein [Pseudomonas chlororaphis]|uniref:DUF1302 domain-containing protein n=1 Tax=Pseudomonas chlororaphis TaxID=587753 RepID=UPI000F4AAACD|nr:DUF1302 domain-containing protein [Pseudomonas chlororaphis]ROL89744.1 hypothetical protein BK637_11100 [Pseudomonas chlororaphis]
MGFPPKGGIQLRHRRPLTGLFLPPLACVLCSSAGAADFTWGEISGRYNGSLSMGAVWSAEKPDASGIFQGNANAIGYGSPGQFNPRSGRTGDDGRLNFRKRNLVSSPVTLMGEMELKWQNYGAFIRGKAWYDYTLSNREVDFGHSANGYRANSRLDDSHFDGLAKFQGLALLDAYVSGDFTVAEHPLNARVGNQAIKWGEGLNFQNGIDAINPLDITALHRPGSQLKVPVPMLYGKLGLSDNISLEAFYQLQWRSAAMVGCGTYFSTNDYLPEGCYGVPRGGANDPASFANDQFIRRTGDKEPSNSGQFGFALRYFADRLDTEFGIYVMNIHSRMPYISLSTDLRPGPGAGWIAGRQDTNTRYFADYPEDIRIYGLSFTRHILGTSVFGEYSFRPNQPVQLATGDLILAFAGDPALLAQQIGQNLTLGEDALNATPGSDYNGYDRRKVSQLSLGIRKSLPKMLGADSLNLTGEVGMKYMHDLPDQSDRRYAKRDLYGSDLASGNPIGCALGSPPQYQKLSCSRDGYTSKFSWGYRLRVQLSYPALVAGVNVSPFMAFGQDVKGWSYDSTFSEGRLLGSVGIKLDYLQDYSAELSWSGSGNAPFAITDKDFVLLSLRMGF